MSESSGGGTPIERVKTLATSGLYLDRRLRGQQISLMARELVAVSLRFPEIEVNVPEGLKEPAVNLVHGSETKANLEVIGHLEKRKTLQQLSIIIPSLLRPLRGVEFGNPEAITEETTGETFFEIFPSSEGIRNVLFAERRKTMETLAEKAEIGLTDLKFDWKPMNARLAYAPPDSPQSAIDEMKYILEGYQEIKVDLLPAMEYGKTLPPPVE